jgi:hypothetical protein
LHNHCWYTGVNAILGALHTPVLNELLTGVSSVIVTLLLYRGTRQQHAWHASAAMTGEVAQQARSSRIQQVMRALIPAPCLPEVTLIALLQICWGGGKVVALGIAVLPLAPRTLLDLTLSCYQVALGFALLHSARWAWRGALAFFLLVIAYKVVEFSLFVTAQSPQTAQMLKHYQQINALIPTTLIAVFDVLKYVAIICFLCTQRVRQAFTRSEP